ncbi:VOC family protein [Mucilaginibacter psychrotolerans]|uniref:VOC family protein n=1 Tax=Mucilaginibacter psychrotolerans TaxID=1524096 RepID=A0A4Y8SLJ1_9SPHI|nr:VOC family protein [Mucilaginibacter psychrotolerans]TFF39575.1 VOC family protein [Mucilaginibacter psychrotolerans]
MKITLTSILVDDQEKALQFYTEKLGFIKKQDIPMGKFRWLSVVSPEAPEGVELVLEPDENPASKTFKAALLAQGIPYTMFNVSDMKSEYERLKSLGVEFKTHPDFDAPFIIASFYDTCGNLIQIYQMPG